MMKRKMREEEGCWVFGVEKKKEERRRLYIAKSGWRSACARARSTLPLSIRPLLWLDSTKGNRVSKLSLKRLGLGP